MSVSFSALNQRQIFAAASIFAATLLLVLPLLLVRYPPLNDYPFHLARIHILTNLNQDFIREFYAVGNLLLSNMAMDLVATPIAALFGAEAASRIFAGLSLATCMGGVIALQRAAHGAYSPWALLAAPFMINGIFRFGFLNYIFGLGVAFLCAAWWIAAKPNSFVWDWRSFSPLS